MHPPPWTVYYSTTPLQWARQRRDELALQTLFQQQEQVHGSDSSAYTRMVSVLVVALLNDHLNETASVKSAEYGERIGAFLSSIAACEAYTQADYTDWLQGKEPIPFDVWTGMSAKLRQAKPNDRAVWLVDGLICLAHGMQKMSENATNGRKSALLNASVNLSLDRLRWMA